MLYYANPCGLAVATAMEAGVIGCIASPAQGNAIPTGASWCADNGAFSDTFDEGKWWHFLHRRLPQVESCVFAAAPDVVGDAAATLARSAPWLPRIRELGYPAALVAQDGLEHLPVPWDTFDALFIGGSTAWKLGPAAAALAKEAKARGKWLHMGRVNSGRRYTYAESIGCDSVDGTFLTYSPGENLPRLMRWLDAPPPTCTQLTLPTLEAL